MTKKSRYLLLLVGFIFFLILAPIIVLYVRGISYDFKTRTFVHTGILAVRTEPKNVNIYLNNKLVRTSSGDINFLIPNEYEITLKAGGYQEWSKRLAINDGQVTWANPQNNYIYLFYSSPVEKTVSGGVLDFYGDPGRVLYLTQGTSTLQTSGYLGRTQTFALPKNTDQILASDSGNKNFVLGNASSALPTLLFLNTDSGNVIDISALFPDKPTVFFLDSTLFALSGGDVYQVDPVAKTKKLLLKSVKTFYPQASSLYYIQDNNGILSLNVTQDPFNQNQVLLNNLPAFTNGDLFVSFNKQIFLLADGSLYQDLGQMEKITDGITESNFDIPNSSLDIFHSGEYDYMDFFGGLNFITRTGQILNNIAVKNNIDYAFYSTDNSIGAIELDSRDSQNQYTLYTGQNIKKFSLDGNGQNILVLDNGELKTVKIR